jgi:hypothetical protein
LVDITSLIVIKTDQLNNEDLVGGPRSITITGVKPTGNKEQPVAISYAGDGGKPYKPCLSMMKVLRDLWGKETDAYIGRGMTLYRDPGVRYGANVLGGIRISHMTDISSEKTLLLTATRGVFKPYKVIPLRVMPGVMMSAEEVRNMLGEAAADGSEALKDAWTLLPPASRKAVSPTGCPPELKAIAEGIDADRAAALAAKSDLADALAGDNGDGETDEAES